MKKIIIILSTLILSLFSMNYLKAETLTLEDIVNELKNSEAYTRDSRWWETNITNTDTTITISQPDRGDGTTTTLRLENGILIFDEDFEYPGDYEIRSEWLEQILIIIEKNKGYKETDYIDIQTEDLSKYTLDNYGLEISKITGMEEYIIKLLKINLETFNLNPTNPEPGPEPEPEDKIPTIEIINSDETTITLKTNIEVQNLNCSIYRSTDNKNFKLTKTLPCNEEYKDENLESSTNYYYKTSIENKTDYSEIKNATTKEKQEENPKTGINVKPTALIVTIIIISIITYLYTDRKVKSI